MICEFNEVTSFLGEGPRAQEKMKRLMRIKVIVFAIIFHPYEKKTQSGRSLWAAGFLSINEIIFNQGQTGAVVFVVSLTAHTTPPAAARAPTPTNMAVPVERPRIDPVPAPVTVPT